MSSSIRRAGRVDSLSFPRSKASFICRLIPEGRGGTKGLGENYMPV